MVVLGALGREAREAMQEDLESTMAWVSEQHHRLPRFTTRSALEGAYLELKECLESLSQPGREVVPQASRPDTWALFEQRLWTLLTQRLSAMESLGILPAPGDYEPRLRQELQAIRESSLEDFFYLLTDLGSQARSNKIRLGPGAGTLPSSLVAWLIGVTDVDPVAQNLMFEAWLGMADSERRSVTLQAPPAYAEALENWVRSRSHAERARVKIEPDPLLAHLDRANEVAGLRKVVHPAWHPAEKEVLDEMWSSLPDEVPMDVHSCHGGPAPVTPTFDRVMARSALAQMKSWTEGALGPGVSFEPDKPLSGPMSAFLTGILRPTEGRMLYQEQVVQALCTLTGCTLMEGMAMGQDLGSGNPYRLDRVRQRCLESRLLEGCSPLEAEALFTYLEEKSEWTLSRSHLACQTALAYEVAWWRIHHPEAFDQAAPTPPSNRIIRFPRDTER